MKNNKLEIYSLGGLVIRFSGVDLSTKISSKAIALLCYLVVNPTLNNRDKLADLLWNNDDLELSRYNLRYTVWLIRRVFKEDFQAAEIISTEKNGYKISGDIEIYCDCNEFKLLYDQYSNNDNNIMYLEKLRELYKGDFLDGFNIKNCYKFDDWLFFEREKIQKIYFISMESLAAMYKELNKHQNAITIYREILMLNPFLEEIHLELIKVYIAIGDRNSAITQYERCVAILRDELNVVPNEKIRNLYKEVLQTKSNSNQTFNNSIVSSDKSKTIKYFKELTLFEQSFKESNSKKKILTTCIPCNTIKNYWTWEFSECIINKFAKELKSIPPYYLSDIAIFNSSYHDIIYGDQVYVYNNSVNMYGKIRIYSSFLKILNILSNKTYFPIYIKDFDLIDKYSYEFFIFTLLNYNKLNIEYFIHSNIIKSEYDIIKKYVNIEYI